MLKSYFGKSPVYKTKDEAIRDVYKTYHDYKNEGWFYVEYGVCILTKKYKWPSE